jgi:hypothetical protein
MPIRLPTRLHSSLTALLCLLLLVGCGKQAPPAVEAFLQNHWSDPLPPQGGPPAGFSELEASLAPQACGQCHAEQFEAWRGSLHSKAMGPGLLWQLQLMDQTQGNRCLRCHTPLAEQKALLALELGWPGVPRQAPPAYVTPDLAHQGLVCAACHVRGHQRFGPPPRVKKLGDAPHGGFVIAEAFQDSRFCAHCHQFPDDGPRIAGKLQEDTYQQWLASPYAQEGPQKRTCQDCHMPDRRHLWRGIHDAEMTRKALDVSLQLTNLGGNRYQARAVVRNSGAGHHFPTYMVAKAELQFLLQHADGREQWLDRHVIGWQVDTGITRELADTRLAAGEARTYLQNLQAPAGGDWRLALIIRIAPGEHYERIYRDSLTRVAQFPATVEPLLRRALSNAEANRYPLLRLEASPGGLAGKTGR